MKRAAWEDHAPAPLPAGLLARGLRTALLAALLVGLLSGRAAAAKPIHPEAEGSGTPPVPKTATGEIKLEKKEGTEHVSDSREWEFIEAFGWKLHLPRIPGFQFTLFGRQFDTSFQLTKFMVLELIAAGLIMAIYIPLARRLSSGEPARGAWDNTWEVLLTFIRNEVAKPGIGEHDADRYVPFLWTMFLFILFNNLLGLFPFGGSATANIYVTGALAVCVFFAIHGSGIAKMGLWHYLTSLWPDLDVPWYMWILKPMIFLIEVIGVLVRNAVLAVRLFANMFAGHMVLATILIFIYASQKVNPGLWATITFTSVLGIVALSLLEIFVAFLQAYIFVFLTSLFMGMAMHPQH